MLGSFLGHAVEERLCGLVSTLWPAANVHTFVQIACIVHILHLSFLYVSLYSVNISWF